jgi:hypothetical protein
MSQSSVLPRLPRRLSWTSSLHYLVPRYLMECRHAGQPTGTNTLIEGRCKTRAIANDGRQEASRNQL